MSNEQHNTPWTASKAHHGATDIFDAKGYDVLTLYGSKQDLAAFIVRAVNSHEALVKALDRIFSYVSYVNIHGVGEQPAPREDGLPQPMRVPPEEFARIFQEIGKLASAALNSAES